LPVEIDGVGVAIDIDVGDSHACAVRSDGRVVCWGANSRGQLGDGTSQSRAHGAFVGGISNIISVHTGDAHTCAVDDELHAICWGANESFQLGDGTSIDRRWPSARHHSVIATGGNRTCGRFAFGQVGCWGEGVGSDPALIENLEEAGRIAIAETHGCAVHLVGVPRCWGDNSRGQLGDGTSISSTVPVDALAPFGSD
jgi:alpha-tubulin suppressor-like RCC1 family protein